jgi:phosphinothricin acetyltransferase
MSEIRIRRALPADLSDLTEIYNHYVIHTAITFDIEPYTPETRKPWLEQFADSGRYQLLVAQESGRVVGYAGSMRFRPKQAYETSVETTIYLRPERTARGLGGRLYTRLFEALAGHDVHRAYAGITQPNAASNALHARFGFREVGRYGEVGRKLGRYWDVLWLEKKLE